MRCCFFVFAMACASRSAEPVAETPIYWSYRGEATTRFSIDELGGEPIPEIHEEMGDFTEVLEFVVQVAPTRNFRDGSEGWWVSLPEFSVRQPLGAAESQAVAHPLRGLGLELRRFRDGEILEMDQAEFLLDGDRGGEDYDWIFALVSPHPPEMDAGETMDRTTGWPFRISREQGLRSRQRLAWTLHGRESWHDEPAWRLTYEGRWSLQGESSMGEASLSLRGDGPVSGTVWLRVDDGRMLAHEFEWSREMHVYRGVGSTATVVQNQRFDGRLEMVR